MRFVGLTCLTNILSLYGEVNTQKELTEKVVEVSKYPIVGLQFKLRVFVSGALINAIRFVINHSGVFKYTKYKQLWKDCLTDCRWQSRGE